MFRVVARDFSEEFVRWTDALSAAKSLIPNCKSWLEDIRILVNDELIWVYSKSHKFPQYIGAGTYDYLVKLFIQETIAAESNLASNEESDSVSNEFITPDRAMADQATADRVTEAEMQLAQERQQKERLLERLKQLGVDPNEI
jgi:hypothetical protein